MVLTSGPKPVKYRTPGERRRAAPRKGRCFAHEQSHAQRTQMKAEKPRDALRTTDPFRPVLELLQGGDPEEICAAYGMNREELQDRVEGYQRSLRRAALAEQPQMPRVGRNDPCPCGSGKKFKKCCLENQEEAWRELSPDQRKSLGDRAKMLEKLQNDVKKGFRLLFLQEFAKAEGLALRLLQDYPEDDRLHDILVTSHLAAGNYPKALLLSRQRWQVAVEEHRFYEENKYYRRQGADRSRHVHFHSPSTWLEKVWIAHRANAYSREFPPDPGSPLNRVVQELKAANDTRRFKARQEAGYEERRKALDSHFRKVESAGAAAIPYLLPLTYCFTWASLFVPDLLKSCGSDECLKLLAELSMFRFPYFSQQCLSHLESFQARAVEPIGATLRENPDFDELKVGLIRILGRTHSPQSEEILKGLVDHENVQVLKWVGVALEEYDRPEMHPYLEKARQRVQSMDKVSGVIQDLFKDPHLLPGKV